MINAILQGVMSLIIGLVSILLAPIDLAISAALPDLSSAISSVGSYFSLALQNIGFAISVTGLSSTAISIIVLYYTFKLTLPVTFYLVKLAIKWYDKIKP